MPGAIGELSAQELAPRAYIIAPINSNAVILTAGGYRGGIDVNGAIPITGFTATYYIPVIPNSHSFSLLGRSTNFTGSLPYGFFSAAGPKTEQQLYPLSCRAQIAGAV
jgi:hypothetical protein